MKKALLIIGLVAFTGTFALQAQSNEAPKEQTENVAMAAEKAAAADQSIEKRVCEHSGKVSYVRKDVCEKSGKVSYTSVSYDAAKGQFVALEENAVESKAGCGSSAKGAAKEGASCCAGKAKSASSAANAGEGCCSGKAKGVAAKDEKACSKDGKAAAGCCAGKSKAKAAKAEPALVPQG